MQRQRRADGPCRKPTPPPQQRPPRESVRGQSLFSSNLFALDGHLNNFRWLGFCRRGPLPRAGIPPAHSPGRPPPGHEHAQNTKQKTSRIPTTNRNTNHQPHRYASQEKVDQRRGGGLTSERVDEQVDDVEGVGSDTAHSPDPEPKDNDDRDRERV